jgi:hypothetical protein
MRLAAVAARVEQAEEVGMNFVQILQLLVLLATANSAPIAAKRLLHERFSYPLDGGSFSSMDVRCSVHRRPDVA